MTKASQEFGKILYLLGGGSFCDWVRREFLEQREDDEKLKKKLWIYGMRRYSVMSLREIAEKVGGMSYYGVSKAVRRLEQEAARDRKAKHCLVQLHREMSRVQT